MRAVLASVLLIACGGGDSDEPVDGENLIQTTLMAEHDNNGWTPAFGFGREEDGGFRLYVGAREIGCSDDLLASKPRDGNYAAVDVPSPVAVGSFADANASFVQVSGTKVDLFSVTGTIQITAVTASQVSAVAAFDLTVEGGRYALNGAVTMPRCP